MVRAIGSEVIARGQLRRRYVSRRTRGAVVDWRHYGSLGRSRRFESLPTTSAIAEWKHCFSF